MFTLVSDICPLLLHAPAVNAFRIHQPTGLLLLLPVSQKGVKLVKSQGPKHSQYPHEENGTRTVSLVDPQVTNSDCHLTFLRLLDEMSHFTLLSSSLLSSVSACLLGQTCSAASHLGIAA
jgi:hypothetical protein